MICCDNEKFDQRCNDLEKWLMERSYSERIVRTQILKAGGESRHSLFERGILELLRVNLLLTSRTIQRFKMSEEYWKKFKFC